MTERTPAQKTATRQELADAVVELDALAQAAQQEISALATLARAGAELEAARSGHV